MKFRVAGFAVILTLIAATWFSCNQPVKATSHTVTLTWGASVVTGACVITAYNIYRSETSGGEVIPNHIAAVSGTQLTYTDASVVNGHSYFYKVTGFGTACTPNETAFSNEIGPLVIPVDPPVGLPPTNLAGVVQ